MNNYLRNIRLVLNWNQVFFKKNLESVKKND